MQLDEVGAIILLEQGLTRKRLETLERGTRPIITVEKASIYNGAGTLLVETHDKVKHGPKTASSIPKSGR